MAAATAWLWKLPLFDCLELALTPEVRLLMLSTDEPRDVWGLIRDGRCTGGSGKAGCTVERDGDGTSGGGGSGKLLVCLVRCRACSALRSSSSPDEDEDA